MHTRASNSELVEPLPEPEHTLNQRLHRRNRRVPFDQRNNPPKHPRSVYLPIHNINYFRHFLYILRNYDLMDDEPMWAADRVVALTPGSAITIPKTANEFAIKGNNNSDTEKIMARMDDTTIKMDAQYKELQSRAKQSTPDFDDDDIPMSCEEEAKFIQTFFASASTGAEGPIPPKTAEQKLARKNELKAKSTLMLAIPDEHLLKFHARKDAKSLWEAIKNRFGGNKELEKLQKTILKQNYENFTASIISQEDANLKLLRCLPSAWNNIALIMRKKSDLDTLSMDDLYNNLKVYESEIKGKSSSSSNSQNVAFVSSDNSSSTNETVNTAHSVSAASSKDQASTVSYVDDVMLSFFSNQSNAPQLDYEDLEPIDADDLNEMDLKWQVAMLTIRVKRFIKKTGRKMDLNDKEIVRFDKTKVECYNCHRRGHFARECRVPRNQGNRNRDALRRNALVDTSTTNALVFQDGIGGYDWSFQAEEGITNFALMAYTSQGYQIGLESLEARIVVHEKNEAVYKEDIAFLNAKDKTGLGYDSQMNESEVVHSVFNSRESDVDDSLVNERFKIAVATKSGQVPVNAAKQSSPRAATSISTARPINTDAPKPKVNDALPITYSYFKAHYQPKAVVSAAVGNGENAVKSSACWIWRPTGNVIDHNSKDSRSYMLKKFNYVDLQGRRNGCSRHMTGNKSFLTDYQENDGRFELKFNLSSVSQMCDKKNSVLFTKNECLVLSPDFKLLDESQVLLKVPRHDNMYSFDLKNIVPLGGLTCLFAKATIDESNLWHRRLGHINFKTMNKLMRGNLIRGLPSKLFENDHTCVTCQKGEQHKASCKTKLVSYISQPLQMLHMDLFRRISVRSINHKIYFLVVTDDYSRFSWVFFLSTKDETSGILKTFITGIENQINHKVKIIRCDNGTEFKNNDINQLCEMKGIKRKFSVSRTPQQNGFAERKNRTLIEATRTMLADSLLLTTFWAEAVSTACYVQNRVLVTKPHNKTPYELLHGRTPSISFMRPFGCPVTILNTLDPLGKFDGKADERFFVGYSIYSKAFRVFNTRTRKVEENLHITFLENKPNVAGSRPNWLFDIDLLTNSMNYEPVTAGNQTNKNAEGGSSNKEGDQNVQDFRAELDNLLVQQKQGYANSTNKVSTVNPSVSAAGESFTNADDLPTNPLMPDLEDTADLLNIGIFSGAYDDEDEGAEADLNNLETTMNVSHIPTTRIHRDHPKDQIIGDINSATQTRRMIKISEEHAMVYRNKKDERVIVVRNKARLVAQGYTQEVGIDYDEVFAPVARIEAIRLFLAYASLMGFIVYQIDVKSAFLYDTIEEEAYVYQPPDDIIFGSTKKSLFTEFESLMHKKFQMSFMVELTFFLGLQVMHKDNGIFISQDKYVADILKKFDFSQVKIVSTPIETNKALHKDEEAKDVDVHLYKSMIGSLMYLIASRPVIMFVVCACARFQVTPKVSRLHAVKRIFRYLKGQPKLGLWYPRDSPFDLEAFSDSDYARASLDRKSTTGDETVYKEWEDRMERAATIASSLEAEQDSGNINKTQSMATLNEPLPQGTGSGSGPRCQVTILGGAEAHTRFEAASKQSNDLPLSRVNTLGSGEDSMKLKELM
ncbi:putative ribonuclease H-like domain-containing protein [Tanacetum coccineum]|uniref:Ribonuclease H-like domain-containing protein n=1 Tax=Tanacetum coccineum TaxID=301880 RepID=A0ABQ4YDV3_9ASTR